MPGVPKTGSDGGSPQKIIESEHPSIRVVQGDHFTESGQKKDHKDLPLAQKPAERRGGKGQGDSQRAL